MHSDQIKISCTFSGGPGASWTVELEFLRTSSGFQVWSTEGDLTDGAPEKRQISDISRPLNWREICKFLLTQRHFCVEGDSTTIVHTFGVQGYEADLIESVFIIDEDSARDRHLIASLLIGFTDEELKPLFDDFGTPTNPKFIESEEFEEADPYETLEEFAKHVKSRGLLGKTLSEIKRLMKFDALASIEKVLRLMVEQKQNIHFEQLMNHAKSVEIKDSEPRKIVCTDQISIIFQELIDTGTPQNDHILRMLDLVSMLDREPLLTHDRQTGFWAALAWLSSTTDGLENSFRACSEQSKDKAIQLASFILSLGQEIAPLFKPGHRWTGGPLGAAIGLNIARQKLSILMRCQNICNELGLRIPERLLLKESKSPSDD